MSLVAQLYGLSVNEAMKLSDKQTAFMLDHAQFTLMSSALTNQNFRADLQQRLSPTTRAVRSEIGSSSEGGGGGIGEPT